MKNYRIAIVLCSFSLMAVCSFSTVYSPEKVDVSNSHSISAYTPHFDAVVFMKNAGTPSVLPVYGKCVWVHSSDSPKGDLIREVQPTSNSPPEVVRMG